MRRYTCTDTGGLCSVPLERRDEQPYLDAAIQGAILHASIAVGDMKTARQAGDLMVEFVEQQPALDARFHNYYCPCRGYLMAIDDETLQQKAFVAGAPRQPYANIGFLLQGLARLHDITGTAAYQRACRRLMDWLLNKCGEDLVSHGQNHKVAYAAILLYRQTGCRAYLNAGFRIAEKMVPNILPDGRVLADVFYDDIDSQPYYFSVRTACDSVLWLQRIQDELGAPRHVPRRTRIEATRDDEPTPDQRREQVRS
jgi:hypothetical protein